MKIVLYLLNASNIKLYFTSFGSSYKLLFYTLEALKVSSNLDPSSLILTEPKVIEGIFNRTVFLLIFAALGLDDDSDRDYDCCSVIYSSSSLLIVFFLLIWLKFGDAASFNFLLNIPGDVLLGISGESPSCCKFSANETVLVLLTFFFFLIGLGISGPSEFLASVLMLKSLQLLE